MGQFQTRKSLSINGPLFRRARDFATARNIPLAKLAEQALEAFMAGTVLSAPVVPAAAGEPEPGDEPVTTVLRPPPLQPFCASCTGPTIRDPEDARCAKLQPIGKGGALVTICYECNELPSSDPRYDIGNVASARPGLSEGGKRVGGNGAGR